jgi:hypothetical protein
LPCSCLQRDGHEDDHDDHGYDDPAPRWHVTPRS